MRKGGFRKKTNNLDAQNNCWNHPKALDKVALPQNNASKGAGEIANSVNPDQTA